MSITELISKVGVENVQFQLLDECLSNISTRKDGISKITFGTPALNCTQVATRSGPVGIIVWMPRDKFNAATGQ